MELSLLPPVPRTRSHIGNIFYKRQNRHKGKTQSQKNGRPGARVGLPDIKAPAEWRRFGPRILGQEMGPLGNISLPTVQNISMF